MEYFEPSMKFWRYASSISYQNLKRTWTVTVSIVSILSGSLYKKCTGKVKDQWIFQTKKWDLWEREVLFQETTKLCTNLSVEIFMILLVFVQKRVYWRKSLSPTTYWFWALNSDTFSIALSPWNFHINRKAWKSRHTYRLRVRKITWA